MRETARRGPSSLGRLLMTVVGLSLLGFYAALAYLALLGLRVVWAFRPDTVTLVVAIALGTVFSAYLSYRVGTLGLLSRLDAVSVPRHRAPRLHDRLDRLVEEMDVDRPEIRVGTLPTPTALSLQTRGGGVVVFDADLLRHLSPAEAEAVLAHELAHLEGNDIVIQTLAYTTLRTLVGLVLVATLPITLLVTGAARAIAWMRGQPGAWWQNPLGRARIRIAQFAMALFALVTIAIRARSRRQEFAADARAARVTGNPMALASALRTIERRARTQQGLLSQLTIGGREDDSTRLFATHPETDARIERLQAIAEEQAAGRWTQIPVR